MNQLAQMLDALGLPAMVQEPEVVAADLARIRAKSLAGLIAKLLNENEPMLKAQAHGHTVTVSERGGGATMRCSIDGSVFG